MCGACIVLFMNNTPNNPMAATAEELNAAYDAIDALIGAPRHDSWEASVLCEIAAESDDDPLMPTGGVAILAYMVDYIDAEGWATDADGFLVAP